MDINTDIQTTVTTNIDLTDQIMNLVLSFMADVNYWLLFALLVAMIITQGVKNFLKVIIPLKFRPFRKSIVAIIAYIAGFNATLLFIDGTSMTDNLKWASLVGFINPMFYVMLKSIAVSREWHVMQAVMRMRPLKRDAEGNLIGVDDTQMFMVGKSE